MAECDVPLRSFLPGRVEKAVLEMSRQFRRQHRRHLDHSMTCFPVSLQDLSLFWVTVLRYER